MELAGGPITSPAGLKNPHPSPPVATGVGQAVVRINVALPAAILLENKSRAEEAESAIAETVARNPAVRILGNIETFYFGPKIEIPASAYEVYPGDWIFERVGRRPIRGYPARQLADGSWIRAAQLGGGGVGDDWAGESLEGFSSFALHPLLLPTAGDLRLAITRDQNTMRETLVLAKGGEAAHEGSILSPADAPAQYARALERLHATSYSDVRFVGLATGRFTIGGANASDTLAVQVGGTADIWNTSGERLLAGDEFAIRLPTPADPGAQSLTDLPRRDAHDYRARIARVRPLRDAGKALRDGVAAYLDTDGVEGSRVRRAGGAALGTRLTPYTKTTAHLVDASSEERVAADLTTFVEAVARLSIARVQAAGAVADRPGHPHILREGGGGAVNVIRDSMRRLLLDDNADVRRELMPSVGPEPGATTPIMSVDDDVYAPTDEARALIRSLGTAADELRPATIGIVLRGGAPGDLIRVNLLVG